MCYRTLDACSVQFDTVDEARRSGMSSEDKPSLGEAILAQVRSVKTKIPLRPADFVKDFVSFPGGSRPAGSVALDFTCDVHEAVSYTHLRAHETVLDLVCRLLLEKK